MWQVSHPFDANAAAARRHWFQGGACPGHSGEGGPTGGVCPPTPVHPRYVEICQLRHVPPGQARNAEIANSTPGGEVFPHLASFCTVGCGLGPPPPGGSSSDEAVGATCVAGHGFHGVSSPVLGMIVHSLVLAVRRRGAVSVTRRGGEGETRRPAACNPALVPTVSLSPSLRHPAAPPPRPPFPPNLGG